MAGIAGGLSAEQMLEQERKRLGLVGPPRALCLSGGGIRSAAYGLGVLQALAAGRLLTRFDYLSTVSGGGFIGGWLQVLIGRMGAAEAEAALRDPQAEEVRNLRRYTNYLTPQVGLLTGDTWTAIALYLRNLLLNWLVIVPVLVLPVLALVFHRTAVAAFGRPDQPGPWIAMGLGTGLLLLSTVNACRLLPSHRAALAGAPPDYAAPARIVRLIVAPFLAWAVITPVPLGALLRPEAGWAGSAALPASYAAAMLGGYGLAWCMQRADPACAAQFRANAGAWLLATALATAALVLAERLYLHLAPGDRAQALTSFAPLALALCHMVQAVILVGLRRELALADLSREWIARVDGMVLLAATGWMAVSVCCLDLSSLLLAAADAPFGPRATWAVGLATMLAGPSAAWLGRQAFSRVQGAVSRGEVTLRRLLDLLALVFAVGLFALLGAGLQFMLGQVQGWLGIGGAGDSRTGVFALLLGLQLLFGLALWALSFAFSRVDVNRFSMHGVYRNRLSRAFLGSALRDREAEPFTGFGPLENPRLATMAAETPPCLFPVINMALNLTVNTHTAWTERKAASFTASPLACGSAELGTFLPTPDFAGGSGPHDAAGLRAGIRFGSALTISGAAVSPNWGYNSSPLAAFLMTLFNVRLGAWLPNPAVSTAPDLRLMRPRNSQAAIFSELLGRTTDRRQSIYLSDGGHFENLGLYEMLRRGCGHMLVVDAGQDGGAAFADLGNAIRKASVDGLATVAMQSLRIRSRAALEGDEHARADAIGLGVGTATYPDGSTGRLIYLKPTYLPLIPAEIRAYGAAHLEFPHESTAEQWFTESQFESYRALGHWQMMELVAMLPEDEADRFEALFRQAALVAGAAPAG